MVQQKDKGGGGQHLLLFNPWLLYHPCHPGRLFGAATCECIHACWFPKIKREGRLEMMMEARTLSQEGFFIESEKKN